MSCKPTFQGERFNSEQDVLRTAANLNIDIDKNGEPILTEDIRKSLSNISSTPPEQKINTTGIAYSIQTNPAFTKANKAFVDRLVNRLKKTGLARDVVYTGNFEAKTAPGNVLTTPKGIVYGYVDADNVVHLNPDVLNMNTPMHEFGHLWVKHIKTNMRPLWEQGKELFRKSSYLREVQASPFYKNKTLDEQIEEAMVRAIGNFGEAELQKDLLTRIKEWIAEVFDKIGTYFGIMGLTSDQIGQLTIDTFTELATADLLSGKNLAQSILNETASTRFTERTSPAPTTTKKGYKLFRVLPDGTLKPLYVDYKHKVPVGVWVDALEGGEAPPSKKKGNRQVTSKLGDLSYRPGWHLGDVPFETHIGRKMGVDKKAITHLYQDVVWAEVEYAADIDYQGKAGSNGLQEIPVNGSYRFKTTQAMTGEWAISGAIRVLRVISDTEANAITQKEVDILRESYPTLTGAEKANAKQLIDAWDKHQGNLPREHGAIEQSYFDQINRLHEWEQKRKTAQFRTPSTLRVSDAGFFSTVEVALEKVPQEKGTPAQMRAMMLMHGAKPAELDWMQWDRFTEGLTSITKSEIQEWIDANRIDVREVVQGGITEEDIDALLEDEVGQDMTREEAREFLEGDEKFETSYPTLVLPGGEAYRELLLTMPKDRGLLWKQNKAGLWAYFIGDKQVSDGVPDNTYKEIARKTINSRDVLESRKADFKSSHFKEPNILAHIRFNERTVNGERVLFIEEFQSDWAQEGKKEGFVNPKERQRAEQLEILAIKGKSKRLTNNEIEKIDSELKKYKISDSEFEQYIKDRGDFSTPPPYMMSKSKYNQGVPDMPFKKTDQWVNLAARRMIRFAAEEGFDRIAWTTAEQQIERNQLSKRIDGLIYKKSGDGLWDVDILNRPFGLTGIKSKGLTVRDIEETFGVDIANKIQSEVGDDYYADDIDGYRVLETITVNGIRGDEFMESFPEIQQGWIRFGLEAALKERDKAVGIARLERAVGQNKDRGASEETLNAILESAEILRNADIQLSDPTKKVIRGTNLNAGGQGMRVFYDAIVPKNISKLGEPFGANIETIDLNNGFGFRMWEKASGKFIGEFKGGYYYTSINGEREYKVPADYKNPEQVAAEMGLDIANLTVKYDGQEETGLLIQPSLPITDSMKQSARQGMPLYQVQNIELQQIKKEALKRGTFMKAPNGQSTNLNEFQWLQVRTTAFKDWFGDWENSPKTASKVVDKNGEPLVVYHGSLQRFTTFDPNRGFSAPNIFHASDLGVVTHWSGALTPSPVTFDDIEQVRALNTVKDVIKAADTLLGYPHNLEKYTYGWRLEGGNVSSPMQIKRNGERRFAETQEELLEAVKENIISSLSYLSTSERGRNYSNYLNIKNPLVVDAKKKSYYQIPFEGAPATANTIASIALERGHDGTIIKNVLETDYENQLTDDYIVSTPNQIKSATDNIGAFSSADNDIRYQIIGEEGASRLSDAITVMANLQKAKDATTKGTDKLTIKRATGWELGGDGLWRYELQDMDFIVDNPAGTWKLSDIWQDEELFKSYPTLADIEVIVAINEGLGNSAYFDEEFNSIGILSTNDRNARKLLIHEIQHFIQVQEGFAIGGYESLVSDYLFAITETLKDIAYRKSTGMTVPSDESNRQLLQSELDRLNKITIIGDGYRQIAGEVEADNAAIRSGMSMQQRAQTLLSETELVAEEDKIYLQREVLNAIGLIISGQQYYDKNRKTRGWVRSKRRSQEANTQPITSEGETSKSGFGLVRATESEQINQEVVYNGEYKQATSNENSNVVIIDDKEVLKEKVLVEKPAQTDPVSSVQALDLQNTYENPEDIDDNLLYDEVFNTIKLQNIEPADEEVLGVAAYVKKHTGQTALGALVKKAVQLLIKKTTASPVASKVNPDAIGSKTTAPNTNYNEAVRNRVNQTGNNLWVRNDSSQSNEDRVLLLQFSSNMLYDFDRKFVRSKNTKYFDTLYRLMPGYNRTADFWEVPLWMANIAGLEDKSDVYVVRDVAEANQFIKEAGYGRILTSVMDVNHQYAVDLFKSNPEQVFESGDYTNRPDMKTFANVSVFNSIDDYISKHNLTNTGYSYRHFEGTSIIPRLTMSDGCTYKCAFCMIPKEITLVSQKEVDRQAEEIALLDAQLVYMNDKTFGQASNYKYLDKIYNKIKELNPNFQGFIVQTTAVDFQNTKKFNKEWLDKAHIKYVELGIETYNDDILTLINKRHSHAKYVQGALQNARDNNIKIIANIIVGLSWKDANGNIQAETKESYTNTMNFVRANADVISHMNVYALAVYEGTDLADELDIKAESDTNENIVLKSFHGDPEIHQWAMDEFSDLGVELIESTIKRGTPEMRLDVEPTVDRNSPILAQEESEKLMTQLNKAFGGKIKIATNLNQLGKDDVVASKLKNIKGRIYGAVTTDGTIYLNPDYLNANTAIHEHGHLFNQIISQTNPALWNKIVAATKSSPLFEQIKNDPNYADLITEDQVADEVFSRLLGEFGAGRWESLMEEAENKTFFDTIREFFQELMESLKNIFGMSKYDDMSLEEFTKITVRDMLSGKPITQRGRRESVRDNLGKLFGFIDKNNPDLAFLGLGDIRLDADTTHLTTEEKREKFKKVFGEEASRVIYDSTPEGFDRVDAFINYLTEKIPIKSHIPFIIRKYGTVIEQEFLKSYLPPEETKSIEVLKEDPTLLLQKQGYTFTSTPTGTDIMQFRQYYPTPGVPSKDVICTFNAPYARAKEYFVSFIVKDDAKETVRAEYLTQDNLSPSWKTYLEKNGRKKADGTYDLTDLKSHREDPFSTSVLSIQILKNGKELKVISRYNHTIYSGENTHPDRVYQGNLNMIADGLHDSLFNYFNVNDNLNQKLDEPDNITHDNSGRYFHYINESNGTYWGDGFYMRGHDAVILNPSEQRLANGLIFDSVANKIYDIDQVWSNPNIDSNTPTSDLFQDITNISFLKGNKVEVTTSRGRATLTVEDGQIASMNNVDPQLRIFMLRTNFGAKYRGKNIVLDHVHQPTEFPHLIDYLWGGDIIRIENDADFDGSQLTSLGNLRYIGADAYFKGSQLTSLGNLRHIGRSAYFSYSPVTSLGNLRYIGGSASFNHSQLTSLGNLRYIGTDAYFKNSQLTSLGNLRYIGLDASFSHSKLTSLGNLRHIGRSAYFESSQLTSLGNLRYIGLDASFSHSKLTSLGNLRYIGRSAYFSYSPVTSLGNLRYIGGSADFSVSQVTSLGNLMYIGGSVSSEDSPLTSLGNLRYIGVNAYFKNSPLTSLGNLRYIGGSAHFNMETYRILFNKEISSNITSNSIFISNKIIIRETRHNIKVTYTGDNDVITQVRNDYSAEQDAFREERQFSEKGIPQPTNNVNTLFEESPQFEAVGTKENFMEFINTYYFNHSLEFAANKPIEFAPMPVSLAPVKMGNGVYTFPTKAEALEAQPQGVQFALVDQMAITEYESEEELLKEAKKYAESANDLLIRDPLSSFVKNELQAGRSIKVGNQTVSPLISARIVDDNSLLREFETYMYLQTGMTTQSPPVVPGAPEGSYRLQGMQAITAPYQAKTVYSVAEAEDFFESSDYLDFVSNALKFASLLDLPKPFIARNIGGYSSETGDIVEVSSTFYFDTANKDALEKFAVLMGALGMHSQEASILMEYTDEENADFLESSMGVLDVDRAMSTLEEMNISSYTFDYPLKRLKIISLDYENNLESFRDTLAKIIENLNNKRNYDNNFEITSVASKYIDEAARRAVYQSWDADAKKGLLSGELLDYVTQAEQADNTFQGRHTTRAVIGGTQEIQRLARPEERGRIRGGERAVEYTILLRDLARDVQGAREKNQTLSQLQEELVGTEIKQGVPELFESNFSIFAEFDEYANYQAQEKLLIAHAKRNGSYINLRDIVKRGLLMGKGMSSVVYMGEGNNVVKVFDPSVTGDIMDALDNIAQFNRVFPNTALKVLGVTEDQGNIRLVLEQKRIPIDTARQATQQELNDYMAERGFIAYNSKDGWEYRSVEHIATDINPYNVVYSNTNGQLYTLDANIIYNDMNPDLGITSKTPYPFNIIEAKIEPTKVAVSPIKNSPKSKDVLARKSTFERLGEQEAGRVILGKLGVELTNQLAGYENNPAEQQKILIEYASTNNLFSDTYEDLAPNQMLISAVNKSPLSILDSLSIYNTIAHVKAKVAGLKRVGTLGDIGFIVEVSDMNYEPMDAAIQRLKMASAANGTVQYNEDLKLLNDNNYPVLSPLVSLELNTDEKLNGTRHLADISTEIRTTNNIQKPTLNC